MTEQSTNVVTISQEEDPEIATERVLAIIADSELPRTLKDYVTLADIRNPFAAQGVLALVRKALKPGGSHYRLTEAGKWLRSGEKWAEELEVEKGKSALKLEPRIAVVEQAKNKIEVNSHLSQQYKNRSLHVLNAANLRGNKKFDKATAEMVVENVAIMAMETAMLVQENETLRERLAEKERHMEEERRLRQVHEERLISIIEKIGDKLTPNALVPVASAAE